MIDSFIGRDLEAMHKPQHPMLTFFGQAPAYWSLALVMPGGLLVANTEYAARNEGYPRGMPWPFAAIFGVGLFGIVICLTVALGGSLLSGYFIAKALGLTLLSYQAWDDRGKTA